MHNNFQKCWRFFILTILQDIFYPVCLESSMLFLLWTLNNHELTAHYEVLVVKRIQNRYILCKMLREKCQYTEFFLVRISRIRAENGKIRTRKNFIFGPLSRKEMFINHFCSMFLFYILSQPFYIGFLVFSGVINWEHWPEMVS